MVERVTCDAAPPLELEVDPALLSPTSWEWPIEYVGLARGQRELREWAVEWMP